MATYNPNDLIGKTLFATKKIFLKRTPSDAAQPIYTVKPGATVGVVDSFIFPKPGRNVNMYWQFLDQNGKYFYAEHTPGSFDTKKVEIQGAVSIEDQKAQSDEEAKNWVEKLTPKLWLFGLGFAGFVLLRDQLKK
jgi:hypothetical protein